jgi:hypothetical protein
MKKKSNLWFSFVLVFIFIFSFTIDARATNDSDTQSLQQVMGIQPDGDYAKADLTTTPEGSVIMATVEDPSKIGGCQKGDRVKLINLGNGEWKITRLTNGSGFQFAVHKEDGVMKITKTETFKTKPIMPENTFQIGLDARYFDYEEPGLMEESGWMYGIFGSYIYHGNNKLMFETSLSYVFGELDYDGQFLDGTPRTSDTDDWLFEWRALIGPDYKLKDSSIVTPFLGIGYRFWNDEIKGSGGYEREIQYWYLPIGVKTISPIDVNWTWGLSVEYDLFLGGKVKSHASDLLPGLNDPENDQNFGDGYGIKFSLQFNTKLSNNYGISIEPYITYWDIDESDPSWLTLYGQPTGIYVVEPENETTEYGLRLKITF